MVNGIMVMEEGGQTGATWGLDSSVLERGRVTSGA